MKIADLPKRRRQVAQLILKGYSQAEIAELTDLKLKSVHSTTRDMRKHLGINNDAQLGALAARDSLEAARALLNATIARHLCDEVFAPFEWLHEVLPE